MTDVLSGVEAAPMVVEHRVSQPVSEKPAQEFDLAANHLNCCSELSDYESTVMVSGTPQTG